MKTVTCPACKFTNKEASAESVCASCGESLAAAVLQQTLDDLKDLNERLREATAPRRTFRSFNGFGTTLLDYRALPDGTYEATRWIIALALPIAPLATYVIEPQSQEHTYGQETSRFRILSQTRLSPARVLRTYLLAVVGLAPLVLGWMNGSAIDRTLGGGKAFLLMIACLVWAAYIILFKLKNEGSAYKKRPAIA